MGLNWIHVGPNYFPASVRVLIWSTIITWKSSASVRKRINWVGKSLIPGKKIQQLNVIWSIDFLQTLELVSVSDSTTTCFPSSYGFCYERHSKTVLYISGNLKNYLSVVNNRPWYAISLVSTKVPHLFFLIRNSFTHQVACGYEYV